MPDRLSITCDARELLTQMDKIIPGIEDVCKDVALEVAKRLVFGARSRVRRATGETADGIHYEESHDRKGYVVLSSFKGATISFHRHIKGYWRSKGPGAGHTQRVSPWNPVPYFLEYGTKYMTERPFFFSEVAIQEAGFQRRLSEAIQAKLDELGFT